MPEYVTPGVYFEPADASPAAIAALRTDVAGFVGIAERGPLDRPVGVESWEQFRSLFGGFLANGYLAYAAKAFFDNGGRRAYFVRVAADIVETGSDPAAPPAADGSYSTVSSTAGFVAGEVVTVRQGDLSFNHRLKRVDGLRRRLVWERPLEGELDPLQPIGFAAGAAAAGGLVRGSDGEPSLGVTASSPGEWGNGLELKISRSSPAATASRAAAQPLDGSATFVGSVVGFDAGTLVRIFQGGTAVREVHRVVREVDTLRRLLTWDRPLGPAFDLADGASPLSIESLEFGLTVSRDGRVAEVFSGLSLVAGHPRHVERATLSSALVKVADLRRDAAAPSPAAPSPFPGPGRLPSPGAVRLGGGRDGVAALTARRLIGEAGSEERRGLRALEQVDEVAMVAIPDALIRPVPPVATAPRPVPEPDPCLPGPAPEAPPGPSLAPRLGERAPELSIEDVFAVQQALVAHCEELRDRVALLDPPLFTDGDETVALGEIRAWRRRFDTTYAALYHPWVRVYDPRRPRALRLRPVPPSGHVAGIFARTDLEVGVHQAPANEELAWAQGVTLEIGAEEQGLLNPLGINCIRTFPGRGIRLYGARMATSDSPWRYVPVRRLFLMIEEAVGESVQWAVFEPNDVHLRQALRLSISSFLESLWERGALAGATPAEAFFVKCDRENNPQEAIDRGELLAEVGVAPLIPAEFVIFRLGRIGDAFEIEEVGR